MILNLHVLYYLGHIRGYYRKCLQNCKLHKSFDTPNGNVLTLWLSLYHNYSQILKSLRHIHVNIGSDRKSKYALHAFKRVISVTLVGSPKRL